MSLSLRTLDQPTGGFPLFAGMFSFGNGEDDDILVGEKPALAKAIFVDDVLIVQSASCPLWIDGKVIEHFPATVNPLSVLSFNENTHLFYGEEEAPAPIAPTIVPSGKKPAKSVSSRLISYVVGVFILIMTLLVVGNIAINLFLVPAPKEAPAPIPREFNEDEYIERILSKDLYQAKKEQAGWAIVAIENPKMLLQEKDLKSGLRTPYTILWINPQKMTDSAKTRLQQELGGGFTVSSELFRLQISGVSLPNGQARIEKAIASIEEQYPLVKVESRVHIVAPRFTIVSTAISNRYAGALLKQGEETVWVSEGGNVFGLGKLKLITANAIVIGTPYGDVTVSKVN